VSSSSVSGGSEYIACSWNYGSSFIYGSGTMCVKFYGYQGDADCGSDGRGGQSVELCPNNQDKTCLFISTIDGIEYDADVFLYGSVSSRTCEDWAAIMGAPSRLRGSSSSGNSSSSGGDAKKLDGAWDANNYMFVFSGETYVQQAKYEGEDIKFIGTLSYDDSEIELVATHFQHGNNNLIKLSEEVYLHTIKANYTLNSDGTKITLRIVKEEITFPSCRTISSDVSLTLTKIGGSYLPSVEATIESCSDIEYGPNSFTCGGQTYKTVVIGEQTWMAENLNYNPGTGNSRCYNNNLANCEKYGRLYDWSTAMALPSFCNEVPCGSLINTIRQGICPTGWHIPTNADWEELFEAVGGRGTAGIKLKSNSGWKDCGPIDSDNYYVCEDAYEFSALPGGRHVMGGGFGQYEELGYWFASEDASYCGHTNIVYMGNMYNAGQLVSDNSIYGRNNKPGSFSIRCVKDD
jgi:uncharacterized protein (TIGR02145 family)